MKSKTIVKQYCLDNVKKIIGLVLIALFSVILLISIPILIKYISDMLINVVDANLRISQIDEIIAQFKGVDLSLLEPTVATYINGLEAEKIVLNEIISTSMMIGIILASSMVVCAILSFVVNTTFKKKLTQFGSEITNELRYNAFSSLMRGELYEINDVSIDDLRENVLDSTSKIGNDYYANHVVNIFYHAICFTATLIVIFCFDTNCGLVALGLAPIYYVIHKYMRKIAFKKSNTYENFSNWR